MASARSIKAGSAFVEFFLDDGPLQRGLKRAEKTIGRFGANLRSNGARLLGFGGALAAPFVAGIKAASDMQETMNKFNVVFGQNAEAVKSWGDNFAGEVGRSKKQIADFLASTQDLFVPIGFESSDAEMMSKRLTQLAVDVASFNNKADSDVLRDFHSALTGGGETVKKYGVIMNVAAMKQELLNQGIDPKKATEQQKVYARMQILLKGTTAAQGDAIRSAGAFENQMKRLTGTLYDAAVATGNALLPAVTPVVASLGDLVRWVEQVVAANQSWIATAGAVVGVMLAVGATMVTAGVAIQGVAFAIGGLAKAVRVAVGAIALVKVALTSTLAILGTLLSPVGLLVGLLAGLAAYALNASGAVGQLADYLKGRLGGAWQTIVELIGAGQLKAAMALAWGGVKSVFAVGVGALKGYWIEFTATLAESFARAFDAVRSVWQATQNEIAGGIAVIIAKAQGLDPDDVLETLREDQDRAAKNRGTPGIEQVVETIRQQRNQLIANNQTEITKAKQEFTAAKGKADALLADGEQDNDAANQIENGLQEFAINMNTATESAAAMQRANRGVDVRGSEAQELLAMAFAGINADSPTDAIKNQTLTLSGKLDDIADNTKNGVKLAEAET